MQSVKSILSIVKQMLAGLLAALICSGAIAQAWQQPERSQANLDALARVEVKSYRFEEAGGIKMEYGVYVPTTYNSSSETPLVIALHGLGSGISYMMEYNNLVELAESYGYLVATPMGYNERGWYGARGLGNKFNVARNERDGTFDPANLGELSEQDVLNVLGEMHDQYNVDRNRTYLIGQSMGGGGSWYIGSKYPDIWAALAPMAPSIRIDPDILEVATHLPVMVVQGDADESVDVEITRRWVAKLEELDMSYEYIEVAGGSHSSAGRENIDKVFEFLSKHRR
jgi:predicted peptidase